MKKITYLLLGLLLFPTAASAQGSLNTFFINLLTFFDTVLIPFMFGMAFLVFVINAIRFFVFQGNNEEGRGKAKSLVLYSILAFVLLVVFWGIVNMINDGLGLEGCSQPMSDYEAYNFVGPTLPNCP